jgi:EAL domain-containing protein (putative c-di-GMP-specific phosphodiesterase class I)
MNRHERHDRVPTRVLSLLPPDDSAEEVLREVLRLARQRTRMEVAFVSRFRAGRRVLVAVDADPTVPELVAGETVPLEETYCHHVANGSLPELIIDAQGHSAAAELNVRDGIGIGTHLGVPIRGGAGEVYGTFCCFSRSVHEEASPADIEVLRVLADVVAGRFERDTELANRLAARSAEIRKVIVEDSLYMVLQPIFDLAGGEIEGYEAFARVGDGERSPDQWFRQAWLTNLGVALELRAVELALLALDELPPDQFVSINVGAAVVESGMLHGWLREVDRSRVVIELTEHTEVDDLDRLGESLRELQASGVRISIDDAGAGRSGLERMVALAPDIIKMDRSLIRGVVGHPARQAIVLALVQFAALTRVRLVAEGIESAEALRFLRSAGVGCGQGFYLGPPERSPRLSRFAPGNA